MIGRTFVILFLTTLCACQSAKSRKSSADSGPVSLGITVGSRCELVGYEAVKVDGHSLVYGLSGTGSAQSTSAVRDYMIKYLRRLKPQRYMGPQYANLTAEQLINSRNTAVVRVSGIVPAGSPKGGRFDVTVTIPWATQTTSLQGGRLITTELQRVAIGQRGKPITRRVTAVAAGSLFVDSYTKDGQIQDTGGPSNLMRAVVPAGGRSLYDRKIGLALLDPDYRTAQHIQNRINARFPNDDGKKVASAANRRIINITVPETYRLDHKHFIALIMALYLQDSREFQHAKLEELKELAEKPGADYEAIALAWEAIGRHSLKYLKEFYENELSPPALVYYSAGTALSLDDRKAIVVLADIAKDDGHPCQLLATKTLCDVASDTRAAKALEKLLDHPDTNLRLSAYIGLRKIKNHRITAKPITDFRIETVASTGDSLICALTDGEPRIVIFGKNLHCRRNVFYETPDKKVTINAGPNDYNFTIAKLQPDGHSFVSTKSTLAIESLIEALANPVDSDKNKTGIALTFSQIVRILQDLCRNDIINADFQMVADVNKIE